MVLWQQTSEAETMSWVLFFPMIVFRLIAIATTGGTFFKEEADMSMGAIHNYLKFATTQLFRIETF